MPYDPALPGFRVTQVIETETTFFVTGTYEPAFPDDARPPLYDHKEVTLRDLAHAGKAVVLTVREPRFGTKKAAKPRRWRAPWRSRHRRMTRRLHDDIARRWTRVPATQVAAETKVPYRTVMRVLSTLVDVVTAHPPAAPERLCLDETHREDGAEAVICDADAHRLIDIVPGNKQWHVEAMLRRLDHPERVRVVVIDFTRWYRAAVRRVLPQATIVADIFHILLQPQRAQAAHFALLRRTRAKAGQEGVWDGPDIDGRLLKRPNDAVPEEELPRVNEVLAQNPELAEVYWQKEAFTEIFRSRRGRASAAAALDAWREGLTPLGRTVFRNLLTLLDGWRAEILAYFDHRVANGRIESHNRYLKKLFINQNKRGDFTRFRARALLRYSDAATAAQWLDAADAMPPARQNGAAAPQPRASGATQLALDLFGSGQNKPADGATPRPPRRRDAAPMKMRRRPRPPRRRASPQPVEQLTLGLP